MGNPWITDSAQRMQFRLFLQKCRLNIQCGTLLTFDQVMLLIVLANARGQYYGSDDELLPLIEKANLQRLEVEEHINHFYEELRRDSEGLDDVVLSDLFCRAVEFFQKHPELLQ